MGFRGSDFGESGRVSWWARSLVLHELCAGLCLLTTVQGMRVQIRACGCSLERGYWRASFRNRLG